MPKQSIRNELGMLKWDKSTVEGKIKVLEATLDRIEKMAPTLGSKWQSGMVVYYNKRLEELRSYAASLSQAQ